jgi:hypothetical protein
MFGRPDRPQLPRRLGVASVATLAVATALSVATPGFLTSSAHASDRSAEVQSLLSMAHPSTRMSGHRSSAIPQSTAPAVPGTVYASDSNTEQVVAVAPDGIQTAVGSGFAEPQGVAVDASGDVLVADFGAGVVYRVAPDGTQTVAPFTGLSAPWGLTIDAAGDVFVSDVGNNQVVELAPDGSQTTLPFSGLSSPYGVAVDSAGNVYATSFGGFGPGGGEGGSAVYKLTPDGTQTLLTSDVFLPLGLGADKDGTVYVADLFGDRVVAIAADGTESNLPIEGLNGPSDVSLDTAGDLLISQLGNFSQEGGGGGLIQVSPDGTTTTLADISGFGVAAPIAPPRSQTITFTSTAPASAAVGDTYRVTALGGASGKPVTFTADPASTGVCVLTSDPDENLVVALTGVGTCVIDAAQVGNRGYASAAQAQQSFGVKVAQQITFTSTAHHPRAGDTYRATATGGSSSNPVVFSKGPGSGGSCTVSADGVVKLLHANPCNVVATQTGDATHYAALGQSQSVRTKRAVQHVRFTSSAPRKGHVGKTYQATAKGGPSSLKLKILAGGACSVGRDGVVSFNHAGTCRVISVKTGNADYRPARAVQRIVVTKAQGRVLAWLGMHTQI